MAIDIGAGASNLGSYEGTSSATAIDTTNPANARGYLNYVETYFYNTGSTGVYIGTFYGSGTSWTNRDSAYLGSCSMALDTFTGLNIDVESGDCLGIYGGAAGSNLTRGTSGGSGYYRRSGNQMGTGTQTYTLIDSNGRLAIGGTGVETGPTGLKTINGLAIGSIKTLNGLAIASVKTLKGL
jgi:hypothetical protein